MTLLDAVAFTGTQTEASAFEILSVFWGPDRDELEQAIEVKALLDDQGLAVSCYTLQNDWAVFDKEANRTCIDLAISRLETAKILGTQAIRLDPQTDLAGRERSDVDADKILDLLAPGMAEVAIAAESGGIRVGVENHGGLVGSTAHVEKLIRLVDRPNFGVNIDFTNFRTGYGEDHVKSTRRLAKHVIHAHIKDFHISKTPKEGWRQAPGGDYIRRCVGGEGDGQWPELVGILADAGYEGAIALEISSEDTATFTTGVANLKRIINEAQATG